MSDRVQVEIADGVADVRLSRPEKLNALDVAMHIALAEVGEQLKTEVGLRAVVLSGQGRAFCAGADVDDLARLANRGGERSRGVSGLLRTDGRITSGGQQSAWVWREIQVPVIAAVHGVALGGGFQIALGADIRLVAPDARLSALEIKWGIIPDMTGTWTLPRLVGSERAKELIFTGRMVSGLEAVEMGLALRADPDPRNAALDLAAEVATRSPDAVRAAKRLLDLGAEPAGQLEAERAEIAGLLGTPNQSEAVSAALEDRAPRFS